MSGRGEKSGWGILPITDNFRSNLPLQRLAVQWHYDSFRNTPMNPTIEAQPRLMAEPYLLKRFDQHARQLGYRATDARSHRRWARALRTTLREIIGFDTMRPAPPKPRTTESVCRDGYTRHRMEIQTEPGIIMPMYALVPEGSGPFPAVICAHGHMTGGKYASAGITEIPVVAEKIQHYNFDYGVQFAKAGAIAFCPDARGFGERQERLTHSRTKGDVMAASCLHLNQMAIPLGQTVTGMWTWDILALARYIHTRSDVLPGQLACMGLSAGGLQTLWATALDEENLIKAAVVSGYFFGYRESLLIAHGHCSCNYVPHLFETADMGDIAALIAPRPLMIETGDHDALNGQSGLRNVKRQFNIARQAYRTLQAGKNIKHDIFSGGHRWHGVASIPWTLQQLSSQA